jgi:hypothetical protein
VLTQVRGGIKEAAATAVTFKSWGLPGYAAQMPLIVRIQRACGQPLASGLLLRFGAGLLTQIITEV